MVRPSALAVLPLMINSNFLGCSLAQRFDLFQAA